MFRLGSSGAIDPTTEKYFLESHFLILFYFITLHFFLLICTIKTVTNAGKKNNIERGKKTHVTSTFRW